MLAKPVRIGIHQIYYDPVQVPLLEPAFIPYDNTANPNREWAEYHIFETEFKKGTQKKFDYSGFVSWKFGQKSRIPGHSFIRFMHENPGADVYFLNPFPMEELLFPNIWLQGEFYHPGILEFSQRLLHRAGYDFDLRAWREPRESFAFCNYWAGNGKFWQAYMAFTGKLADLLRTGLGEDEREFLHSIASRTNNFSYIAFVMERMFSVFLQLNPQLNWRRYPYAPEEIRRRFPGFRARAFAMLATRSAVLAPLRGLTAIGIKFSRRGKEP
jgi:hypothetical protein